MSRGTIRTVKAGAAPYYKGGDYRRVEIEVEVEGPREGFVSVLVDTLQMNNSEDGYIYLTKEEAWELVDKLVMSIVEAEDLAKNSVDA